MGIPSMSVEKWHTTPLFAEKRATSTSDFESLHTRA